MPEIFQQVPDKKLLQSVRQVLFKTNLNCKYISDFTEIDGLEIKSHL